MYKIHKVIKFAEIEQNWDDIEDYAITELEKIFQDTKNAFYRNIEKKGLLNVDTIPDLAEIDKLQLKYKGEIKTTIKNALLLSYLYSKASALNEMRQVHDSIANIYKKTIPIPEYSLSADFNLNAEKAIEHFINKMSIKRSELEIYMRKAFTITGVEDSKILGEAKNILHAHITTGDRRRTERALRKLWDKYETTGRLTDAGKLSTAARIDTIIRNNVSEAMSEGRRAMYEDVDIIDEIVAYTVSAIIDDNTTEYCESIDGQTYPKDEFEFPPYHHKCRTIPLPIFRGEEHTLKNWKESPYEFY